MSKENILLKESKAISSEEITFLNNYIISLKRIINTIILTYSKEIKKISNNVKNYSKNSKMENNNIIIKIKKSLEEYSNRELQLKKKIFFLIKQLLIENKFLRYLLINKKPNKNDFYEEKEKLINNEAKLNFNYDDFLVKIKKIENNFEDKFLNYSHNYYSSKEKSNSIKKNDKKKSYYNNDINLNDKNNKENNIIFEKKKIRYNRNKNK